MDETEVRRHVLDALAVLSRIWSVSEKSVTWRVDHHVPRLDAIARRLDDQDMAYDVLVGKVDRLAVNTAAALKAAGQALDRTTSLGRRV